MLEPACAFLTVVKGWWTRNQYHDPSTEKVGSCVLLRQRVAAAKILTAGWGLCGDDGLEGSDRSELPNPRNLVKLVSCSESSTPLGEITTDCQKMSVQHRCSRCGSTHIDRLPRSRVIDKVLGVLKLRPYRCRCCYVRFYDRIPKAR